MPVDVQKDQDITAQHGSDTEGHNTAAQHGSDTHDRADTTVRVSDTAGHDAIRLCWRCENVLRQKGVILKRTDNHAICQHVICSVCKRYAGGGDFQIMGQLDKQTVKKRGVW